MKQSEYTYVAGEYYDDLYDVRMHIEELTTLLQSSKRINKDYRVLLLQCIEIINALEKS